MNLELIETFSKTVKLKDLRVINTCLYFPFIEKIVGIFFEITRL